MTESDYTTDCMRESARKAIASSKVYNYYTFWSKETSGWQKLAKKILQEEIHNAVIRDKKKDLLKR